MSVFVSHLHEQQYRDKGWVEVGQKMVHGIDGPFLRFHFVDPEKTCLQKMRTGMCLMDIGHRGRHTTVTFYCDGCGKTCRGQVYRYAYDSNGDPDVAFCWFCCEGPGARKEQDRMYREIMHDMKVRPEKYDEFLREDEELAREQGLRFP